MVGYLDLAGKFELTAKNTKISKKTPIIILESIDGFGMLEWGGRLNLLGGTADRRPAVDPTALPISYTSFQSVRSFQTSPSLKSALFVR
jgi:hypothetical protein